jgi:membrane-bound lytic murein transglycosylase D
MYLKLIVSYFLCALLTACGKFPRHFGWQDLSLIESTQNVKSKVGFSNSHVAPERSIKTLKRKSQDLWSKIRADFKLPNANNRRIVQAQIRWLTRHPRYIESTINRASPYLYYIYDQIKIRHLPAEMVLLPIIESAYVPTATNQYSGAAGLWQLIPGTARHLGVRQDRWFDGRKDIYVSTEAALDYLNYLHRFFKGDWLLALAAYDTGEGNVRGAIRYNAYRDYKTTFWSLPLSIETRSYVPRLLALVEIVKHPEKYHITLPVIRDEPYLARVKINQRLTLYEVAHLSGVNLNYLRQLNSGIRRQIIPTKSVSVVLPVSRLDAFNVNFSKLNMHHARLASQSIDYYRVRPGDNLFKIAKRFRVKTKQLKNWNALSTDLLKPGQRLRLVV